MAVADLAEAYAEDFQAGGVARCIGLLHDAGKYTDAFQRRLEGGPRVDHSTAGAKIAVGKYGAIGRIMAYCICGHHGGMPDGIDAGDGNERKSLHERLNMQVENHHQFYNEIALPRQIEDFIQPSRNKHEGFRVALYTRMLFSALVDADGSDAERWTEPENARQRVKWSNLDSLVIPFFEKIKKMQGDAAEKARGDASTECVYAQRMSVYHDCLRASNMPQGMYTLTVPTGGGKTLASLAFALRHAQEHGMKRVIYTIPFTSIIEQNADVFRRYLGEDAVLEHHSNYDIHRRKGESKLIEDDREFIERLAAENFNAPIIVTTNVQFFESLFSNKPSRCRKLHNFANSVIILDEVQTLPDEHLKPCIEALRCLCRDYHATVVLCTATQPALNFLWKDDIPKEIISDPQGLYKAMRKVDVIPLGLLDDEALSERLKSHPQVLCIVNTRTHARTLFDMLPADECTYHLSALMCPEHRTRELDSIRKRLNDGLPCRVISTQLVEAGVDIDFPIVYRAAAGIDSIAQAAGRCNREGKQKIGQTYVFVPPEGLPKGQFAHAAQLGNQILASGLEPLGLEAIQHFFTKRYRDRGDDTKALDKCGILNAFDFGLHRLNFPFERVAHDFTLIDSPGVPVVIPYDLFCKETIAKAEYDEHPWKYARQLQRYTVTVYPYEFEELMDRHAIKTIKDIYSVLDVDENTYTNAYGNKTGLKVDFQWGVSFV